MKPKTIRILLLIVGCAQAEPEAAEPAAQPVTAQDTAPSDAPVDQPVAQTQSNQGNTPEPAAMAGRAPTITAATQETTEQGIQDIGATDPDTQGTMTPTGSQTSTPETNTEPAINMEPEKEPEVPLPTVTTADFHACLLEPTGKAVCWGVN